MKKITLRAGESLLEAARAKARSGNTALDEQFSCWLAGYAHKQVMALQDATMKELREDRYWRSAVHQRQAERAPIHRLPPILSA